MLLSAEAASKYFSPVRRIQRAWKKSFKSVFKLLEEYVDPWHDIQNGLPFEGITTLLRRQDVLSGTKNLLQRLLRIHVGPRNAPGRVVINKINTRVFLTSYMVRYFPNNTFENVNALKVLKLREASEEMLGLWYEMIEELERGQIPDTLAFRQSVVKFQKKFDSWHGGEDAQREVMAQRLQVALHMIYTARDQLETTDPAVAELNNQAGRLRAALERMPGGPARVETENAYERVLRGFRPAYE